MRYRHGRKLVGDRTAKSRLNQTRVVESQFADDAVVYVTSHSAFESATKKFIDAAAKWGLTVSISKTRAW